MNIRIISGRFGGRRIESPNTKRTHPMSERVRSAMFNSIGSEINGANILDAFAGTGSLGLEALSRGARKATFIEKDKIAQKVLSNNIKLLDVEDETVLIKTTVNNWLEAVKTDEYDIIFVDPPYHDTQFSTVKKIFGLLKPSGLMILSHPDRGEAPSDSRVVVVDNRSYAGAVLTYYRRVE